jgi:hypothetical protein
MMVSVFGPGMEKVLNRVSPQGPSGETGEWSVAVNDEDHVWFEDRCMVASLCDEWLTTFCGLILG